MLQVRRGRSVGQGLAVSVLREALEGRVVRVDRVAAEEDPGHGHHVRRERVGDLLLAAGRDRGAPGAGLLVAGALRGAAGGPGERRRRPLDLRAPEERLNAERRPVGAPRGVLRDPRREVLLYHLLPPRVQPVLRLRPGLFRGHRQLGFA